MSDQELQALVQRVSLAAFGRPFTHRAVFNRRLRTTGGRYHLNDHHIDINPKMLTDFDMDTLIGVIKHELVHYHLHLAGQTGQHKSAAFKALLAEVGGLRYAPTPKQTAANKKPRLQYSCCQCGQVYWRQRRIDTQKYVCGRCQGTLVLLHQQAS